MNEIDRARSAPQLDLPVLRSKRETGLLLDVKRVAVSNGSTPIAWLETTDGTVFRLPDSLFPWAFDTVALVAGMGGNQDVRMFPTPVEFGILESRAYAEFVQVSDVPGSERPS